MCGFVGQYHPHGVDAEGVFAAAELLAYRGPDDSGTYHDTPYAVGFRRLSILDLSKAGHQPMQSEDGSLVLTHNGEIYNYLELREELKKLGRTFHTGSDTEVILAAYAEWGAECFAKFNGMWAMAMWDARRKELILSRDRFGEKPLYYARHSGGAVFGSEMKALLPLLGTTPPPNPAIIHDYLIYGFHDHTEETFFSGIQQLVPGHYAVVSGADLRTQRYWQLQPDDSFRGSPDEASDRFRTLFLDSVRLRLRSDVPIGSCLSGGLDSSTIVLAAHSLLSGEATTLQQETFTSCVDDPRIDERRYSALVADQVRARKNEVFPSAEGFREQFQKLLWHQEEPFLSMSIYAQWEVMRTAKDRGIKVLLDGQGGDEVLSGYLPFYGSFLAHRLRSLRLASFISEARSFLRTRRASLADVLPTFALYLLPRSIGQTVLRVRGSLELNTLNKGFRDRYFRYPDLPRPFDNQLKNHMYRLLQGPGLRALLHYEDRNAMAFSIEPRVPFLDHRLASFTLSLPDTYLIGDGTIKKLLRRAFRDLLPPAIRDRQDKIGFAVPQAQWMREGLGKELQGAFGAKNVRSADYLDVQSVQGSVRRFLAGDASVYTALWRWYNLEAWLKRFYG